MHPTSSGTSFYSVLLAIALGGFLIATLGLAGPPEPPVNNKPFRQLDSQWSTWVSAMHDGCVFEAMVEHERALIQGGNLGQAEELANGVYFECILKNKLAI